MATVGVTVVVVVVVVVVGVAVVVVVEVYIVWLEGVVTGGGGTKSAPLAALSAIKINLQMG